MILIPQARGKRYGVVGLGKSGKATIASLLASGAEVIAWDDAQKTRAAIAAAFPAAVLKPISEWDYAALASLVMSPGILLSHPAVLAAQASGVEVIGDIELLWRAQPEARYIAITGTNGKSTTTSLIGHILTACGKRVEVGGNLGIPALALAPLGEEGIYVLELSSYQLDLVRSTRFGTAILLNISPDHIDHHGSMDAYIQAKLHIFARQQAPDTAIVGVDDEESLTIAERMLGLAVQRVIPISVTQQTQLGVDVVEAKLHAHFAQGEQGDLTAIRSLQGAHNWQNAAAAYAACRVNGCGHDETMAAMATYPGLAHRMQWLGEHDGIRFVNDSKATNADAAEKALLTYDDIYWIAGGVAKEGGIEPLAPYFPKIRHAYLIGEASADFAKVLSGAAAYTECGTLETAFAAAVRDAKESGDVAPVVMLSPACASFDQFTNFELRGAAFIALVEQFKQPGETHAATA